MEYDYKLDEICHLPPRWDDRDAKEPDQGAIAAVRSFLKAIMRTEATVVPMTNGGILVESNTQGYDVEVKFGPNDKVESSWRKHYNA